MSNAAVDKIEEKMDSQDIDVEYQGMMSLDDTIFLLFDDGHWKTDRKEISRILSDTQVGITEQTLANVIGQLKQEARHELQGMSHEVKDYLDRVLQELEVDTDE